MKVVINKCFGGFGLSREAIKRMAELNGRECYFFMYDFKTKTYFIAPPREGRDLFWMAFDIPNPNEVLIKEDDWLNMTLDERKASNELANKHALETRPDNRHDPLLIKVVEELGVMANGACAELVVVEIPDGVEYEIDEYDGLESVHEKHRSWG